MVLEKRAAGRRDREQKIERLKLQRDCQETFATPHGKRVLRFILEICRYQGSVIGGNPQLGLDVDRGTLYQAARRDVYIELRSLVDDHILREVEYTPREKLDEELDF